ncbi:hypothetical protein THAOC_04164 [Thalassiosira oceanica]|uniref:Uncharacterized protein n=1 Tax=Thalassiosira oceanica TaxID=159749 RepID=K0T5Y1_THAOC|nr:hypothetical protein THAOC_04164 [Thalassiosira oceanica]|mmetsp:Transcript_13058/g.29787  ORF Transcript_13058/g.29787 Transcript_13058/m.29787 type:complete len:274 (+) Transcript_13058:84-905(+)|eukprot:EJK74173.1 hypothetical protein THAOC_04164 [Thalassiosira oceanica]
MRRPLCIAIAAASLPVNTLALAPPSTKSSAPGLRRVRATTTILDRLESTVEKEGKTAEENGTAISSEGRKSELSPFLQELVDDQRELQMNVGKAMDVLRKDYPDFLRRAPDYSIYNENISFTSSDDANLRINNLAPYKQALGLTRRVLGLMYDAERSVIQSRMVYDPTRTQVRVSFSARLVPKRSMLALARTAHVDGISVYSIDVRSATKDDGTRREDAGKVIEHRIEKLLVNGVQLKPPYLNQFGLEMISDQRVGALAGACGWGPSTTCSQA